MKAIIIAATIALTGCATPMMWVKDGAEVADFERDRLQCLYEVAVATGVYLPSGNYRTTGQAAATGAVNGLAIGLHQRDLAILCMKARGYHQVPMR